MTGMNKTSSAIRGDIFLVTLNSVGSYPSFSIRMVWLLFFFRVSINGACPASFPSMIILAPIGLLVTGTSWVNLRLSRLQLWKIRRLEIVKTDTVLFILSSHPPNVPLRWQGC
jgi:hypothetical protein